MKWFSVRLLPRLCAEINLPGDKSIAHRSIIISSLSRGKTKINNFPLNKDCLYTLNAFRRLGVEILQEESANKIGAATITVFGRGLFGLKEPKGHLFLGDSGTSMRLILGVLAGQNFKARLYAGKSLSKRPMLRVIEPLRKMGAMITEEHPPITIKGGNLRPITYRMPVASAQVKSAILLAALLTPGATKVIEPIKTRDHTERILKLFKAGIKLKQNNIVINGRRELISPKEIYIPADISSAAFFIVMATIMSNSKVLIKNLGLNTSRLGIIRVLKRMGADIRIQNLRFKDYEPMGDLIIKSSALKGTVVKKEEIPSLIDELPVLMVAACCAKGKTILKNVDELRVKETDRIRSMSINLKKMGAIIKVVKEARKENIIIESAKQLRGCRVLSFGDHRTAMSMVVAAQVAQGNTLIDDITCINKSFPGFLSLIQDLSH